MFKKIADGCGGFIVVDEDTTFLHGVTVNEDFKKFFLTHFTYFIYSM